ncbi:MAG: hypothetical protein ACRDGV_01050 [Candidatus Limnocylindria bacterium]
MEALPDGLRAALEGRFPGYHVPGFADEVDGWAPEPDRTEPPFFCRGDFDGDGQQDFATFVLGQGRWRLVAAHHYGGEHVLHVLDRFPGRDEAFTKANPAQRFRLRTLEAGGALVIEGSIFEPSRHPFDSIVLVSHDESNGLMHYRWRERRNAYAASAFGSLTD